MIGQSASHNLTVESRGSYGIRIWIFESTNSSQQITYYELSVSYIGPCASDSVPSVAEYRLSNHYWRNRTYLFSCSNFPCAHYISSWPYSDYLITVTLVIDNIRGAATSETFRTPPIGKTCDHNFLLNVITSLFVLIAPFHGYPLRVTLVQVVDMTTLFIEWEEVKCLFQGSATINYTLRYGIYDETLGVTKESILIDSTSSAYTLNLTGLNSNSIYIFEVAAYNMFGAIQFYIIAIRDT